MKSYNIMENGCAVGTATVEAEGLYLNIRARFNPSKDQIYRLILTCESKRIDLGVCVPEDNCYVANKRIQRRLIDVGGLEFALEAKESEEHMLFIPLDSEKPFNRISQLRAGCFENRNGVCGVVII